MYERYTNTSWVSDKCHTSSIRLDNHIIYLPTQYTWQDCWGLTVKRPAAAIDGIQRGWRRLYMLHRRRVYMRYTSFPPTLLLKSRFLRNTLSIHRRQRLFLLVSFTKIEFVLFLCLCLQICLFEKLLALWRPLWLQHSFLGPAVERVMGKTPYAWRFQHSISMML